MPEETTYLDAFTANAKALAPHQDGLHNITPEALGIPLDCLHDQDIVDYVWKEHGEYLAGMAEVICAATAAGIEAADIIGTEC